MFGLEQNNSTAAASYSTEGKKIVKLKELVGQEKRLFGFLITKPTKYGRSVLLCAEDCLIALPDRYLRNFTDSASADDVAILKSGTKKITNIVEVTTKDGNTTYSFDLADI